jgi:hypothetical protein
MTSPVLEAGEVMGVVYPALSTTCTEQERRRLLIENVSPLPER